MNYDNMVKRKISNLIVVAGVLLLSIIIFSGSVR